MRKIFWFIITAILILFITTTIHAERIDKFIEREVRDGNSSQEDERLIDIILETNLSEQTQAFQIDIELIGVNKTNDSPVIIKGINTFQIKRKDHADEDTPYTVIYFLDGIPIEIFQQVFLPFILKRNYRGLSRGEHTLGFKIVDQEANVGIDTIRIEVEH